MADVTTWLLAMTRRGKQKRKVRGKELPHGPTQDAKVKWGHNSQVTAKAIVRACLNWAVDQGYLTHSPLGRLKAGGYHRRERVVTPEEKRLILTCIRDGMFADFFTLLTETGIRPFSEAAKITEELIDWHKGTVTFQKHKNARKGKTRVVYLTPKGREILWKRAKLVEKGALLFHTRNGFPFQGTNTVQRVRRIEKVLGIPRFSLYSVRPAYITQALERGLSSDIVAELVGNTPKTIAKYYCHLDSKKDTLRAMAERAVGKVAS